MGELIKQFYKTMGSAMVDMRLHQGYMFDADQRLIKFEEYGKGVSYHDYLISSVTSIDHIRQKIIEVL